MMGCAVRMFVAQDRVKNWAVVKKVMNRRVPSNLENLLPFRLAGNIPSRTLLEVVGHLAGTLFRRVVNFY